MRIFILGGFLGSGKTSLLLRIAGNLSDKGEKVAIIVNESGSIGVDGETIKQKGYDSIELPDGCICCTLAGSLQNALKSIKEDIDPDIILVEPTGLALPHKVKDMVRTACIDEESTQIIGIVDVQRFKLFVSKKKDFFIRQLSSADFIVINKEDLAKPGQIDEIKTWLSAEFPGKQIVSASVKNKTNLEKIYELMTE